MAFVSVLLRSQIELVEDDLAHLDNLLMRKLEVLVCRSHLKVRVNKIGQSINVFITDNRGKVRCAEGSTLL